MPDLLPQFPQRAAPDPSSAPPRQPARSSAPSQPEREQERETREKPESFSDTYEAVEAEEKPEATEAEAPAQEGENLPQTGLVVATDVKIPADVDAVEAEVDLLQGTRVKGATTAEGIAARAAAEGIAARAPTAAIGGDVAKGNLAGLPQNNQRQQSTPVATGPILPAEDTVDTPVPVRPATPDSAQIAATPQRSPAPALPPEQIDPEKPLLQIDAEPEPELSERIGPREATTTQVQTQPTAISAAQQAQAQTVANGADPGPAPLDEIAAPAIQPAGTAQTISPTAPGATPVQIAQHAAGQIVAALPRDQGVLVTDAGTEIALDPPELGRVRMIVTEVAGGLALTVTAERQETLDLFRRNAQMLAQEFAREGLSDTQFAFEGEGDGQAEDRKEARVGLRVNADTQDLMTGVAAQVAAGGGLDLRL